MPDRADDLAALAGKYRTLEALRRRREHLEADGATTFTEAEGPARRDAFRRVAARFPGALRELDATPADVLGARAAAVEAALAAHLRGDPPPPDARWIDVVLDFHETLRRALAVKLWLARRIGKDGAVTDAVLAEARAQFPDGGVDRALLERHHHPPGGRVLNLVWDALAARHALPRRALEELVFGPAAVGRTGL
jgi:hypothetical protein